MKRLFLTKIKYIIFLAIVLIASVCMAESVIRMQTSFNAGEVSPRLAGRIDFDKYKSGCSELTNFVVLPQGGIQNRPGFEYIASAKSSSATCRLVPFEFSTTQAYILEFGNLYIRFYADGGQVVDESGDPVEVTTTYTTAELDELRFAQSADVLFIAHKNHAPAMLQRTSASSFTLTDITYDWPPFNSENTSAITMTASGTTGSITITFSDSAFSEDSAGLTSDHVGMSLQMTHTTGGTAEDPGFCTLTAVTSTSIGVATVNEDLPTKAAIETWSEGSFNEIYGYPSCVTFYEDRLVFAASEGFPQRIWLSKSGDYYNFEVGTADDDAIARSINADQVNSIVWLKSAKQLHYGTIGGEGYLASSDSGALTPTSVTTKTESRYGSVTDVAPVNIGNETIFLQRPGKTVRRYAYDYTSDTFVGTNLSILADHLTMNNTIEGMAYQQSPYSIIWCVRDDGKLLGLTYMQDHEIVAWHVHETDGEFESVASIPGDTDDELWAVVKREINGSDVRYIERLKPFFTDDDTTDAFFVDSGLTYSGTAATTISGLDHLIGETVTVLADGAQVPDKVVDSSGEITLAYAASDVHVGLGYTSDMVTLNAVLQNEYGVLQAQKKRINTLWLRFYNTFGAKISADGDTYDEVHFPLVDNEISLFTGDKEIKFPGDWDEDCKIYVRQDLPLPMTLLALIPQIDIRE